MKSKITGLIYDKAQEEQLNLVLLIEKLPIDIENLNWLMINLCSILLELVKRKYIKFPQIDLETIYISKNVENPLPYILSYVNIQLPQGKREQLNYEESNYDESYDTLQKVQSKLLSKIGYIDSFGIDFYKNFRVYLIQNKPNIYIYNRVSQEQILYKYLYLF
ncbi:unnamed protein product [Paramecium sonneborni]|uniref:Uncharacterized protein n=1 Tax=Paramecium sonneborni TaxID=65129 RepID=A0A8S1QW48_9CILI|nr:unnamed protein product [Paramecium sonneborni]